MLLHPFIIYITLFIIYSTLLYSITLFKFLSSQAFQWSKDNVAIEESKFSIFVTNKEKDNVERDNNKVNSEDNVEGDKNKVNSEDNVEGDKNKVNYVMMNDDDSNLVVKVSNLIEPSRDKDGKVLYDLIF